MGHIKKDCPMKICKLICISCGNHRAVVGVIRQFDLAFARPLNPCVFLPLIGRFVASAVLQFDLQVAAEVLLLKANDREVAMPRNAKLHHVPGKCKL